MKPHLLLLVCTLSTLQAQTPAPLEGNAGASTKPPTSPRQGPAVSRVGDASVTKSSIQQGHSEPVQLANASKDAPFSNSLGMKFVPLPSYQAGRKVLCSIWETRSRDYAAFMADPARDYEMTGDYADDWKTGTFLGIPVGRGVGEQAAESNHPVVSVSWTDATAFCAWLTKTERAAGRIGPQDTYQLPSDQDWSYAVGIGEQEAKTGTPESKDGKLAGVFPWGTGFPPPTGSGNYSDATAKAKGIDFGSSIEGYDDGFATTAPVGSFKPNELGIYDLGGNVWEWCEDWYDAEQKYRVLRGACWGNVTESSALSSGRINVVASDRNSGFGFRCVLVVGSR